MKNVIIVFGFIIVGCTSPIEANSNNIEPDLIEDLTQELVEPICPQNHKDSIIPIIYGYPSEALFARSDSGLVALGGCELADENYFCKIHQISF